MNVNPLDWGGNARRRLQRLEELRRDLEQENEKRYEYAIEILLAQLRVKKDRERLEVACVLCDYPPVTGKAEAPLCVARLCARLSRSEPDDLLPAPPKTAELVSWIGEAATGVLTEALDTLKAVARDQADAHAPIVRQEAEICRDALKLARRLRLAEAGEACVRVLRFFTAEFGRGTGPLARQTTILRDSAGRALGAISPDALYHLWYTLGSPDSEARQDVLPALDYMNDPRCIPYLIRLLERRGQWSNGEMVGWSVVRAFGRIADRRAIPALRHIAVGEGNGPTEADTGTRSHTSPELAREARRVMLALEGKKENRERDLLLRPSTRPGDDLLRPASPDTAHDDTRDRTELLRPEEKEADTDPL